MWMCWEKIRSHADQSKSSHDDSPGARDEIRHEWQWAAQGEVEKKHKLHVTNVEVGSQCSARNKGPALLDVKVGPAVDIVP